MSSWNSVEEEFKKNAFSDFKNTTPKKSTAEFTVDTDTDKDNVVIKKEKSKKKNYLRLDITDLNDYIVEAAAYMSLKKGKQVSKTAYIQELIIADKKRWEQEQQNQK